MTAGNPTVYLKAQESIYRGDPCPMCGAAWHEIEEHYLIHKPGCRYLRWRDKPES